MSYVILDTNVLVSALWTHLDHGNPAYLLRCCVSRRYRLVYSHPIYQEYEEVLRRPKFRFDEKMVDDALGLVRVNGLLADPVWHSHAVPWCSDASDQMFYDASRSWDALLITGNKKHFPDDPRIFTPGEFLANRPS